ncbi:MAG TPA: FAD-dependent oxidoreductase [Candidatus Saccharimonadales bacterium]
MRAKLIERKALTDTITSFSFEPEQPFDYTAGQFIELYLEGHVEHRHTAMREFTLSSSPHEDVITVTTRVGKAAHSPFKRALDKLEIGAQVSISQPWGDFVLPKLLQTPLIFVAGGIGVTPFRSMLEWLTYTDESRPIKMIYNVKNEDDIIFQETFNHADQHVTIVVDEPSAAWGGERGPLTAEMICGLEKPSDDTLIYLSGAESFVQRIQKELLALGVSNQQIVLDEFQGYNEV